MSRRFGKIFQFGYVVTDIERAMKHWIDVNGVGPFFVGRSASFREFRYRGQASDLEMTVAHAYSGDCDIELIQQTGGGGSVYKEFLARRGEGLQHVGVLTTAFDADVARHKAAGLAEAQGGVTAAGVRFAYYDTEGDTPGSMVEVVDANSPIAEFLSRVRAASIDWDGSDPVRQR